MRTDDGGIYEVERGTFLWTMCPSKHWRTILWRYYHINKDCLAPAVARLREVYPRGSSSSSSSSSSADFIDSQNWKLAVDIMMQRGETAEQRTDRTSVARRLLASELAAACMKLESAAS